MAKTLDQTVSRWQQGASGAQQAFTDGVNNTTVDVVGRAIANQAGLLNGFTQAVNSGFWASQLSKVGTSGWKNRTVAKAANYGTGITAGADRYASAMSTWLPRIIQAANAAKQMPGATLDQRIARSAYVQRTLYNAKRGL
jgi:hypothetical protein